VNADELLRMMDTTRPTRHAWIGSAQPTITAVINRYPRLQDMNKAVSNISNSLAHSLYFIQCFDVVGWVAGRASGL